MKRSRSESAREQTLRAKLTTTRCGIHDCPPLTHTNSSKRTSSPYWLRWFVLRLGHALDRGIPTCSPKELRRCSQSLRLRVLGAYGPLRYKLCKLQQETSPPSTDFEFLPHGSPCKEVVKTRLQDILALHRDKMVSSNNCYVQARADSHRPQISNEDEEIIVELLCK